jgi:circadian clock protein KaiC
MSDSKRADSSAREPTPCASSGVSGLDEVLRGGFARDHVYLVEGDPGTGKTTLALQFLLAGAEHGETVLYVTLSESAAELHAVGKAHGWSLDAVRIFELAPSEAQLLPDNQYTFFHPEEIELSQTVQNILRQVEEVQPSRLVIDSLAELRLLAQQPQRYRRQALALKQYFVQKPCTVLLLDDRTSQTSERQLHSVVHGVLTLERNAREYGKNRRRLEVTKLRGSLFMEGYHDLNIDTGGLSVFPRLLAAQHVAEFVPGAISSDVPELDALLGGGLDRGSSTLVIGPAGAGKTTVAMKYAAAAVKRGERVAFYTFDEGMNSLLARSEALHMPLQQYRAEQRLLIEQIDPAELSPGEFAFRVRRSVEQDHAQMIVIDTLNGYLSAMPEEHFLILQMHELLSYLGQQGVVTILVLAQHGVIGQMHSPVDLSYLADTILLLRYFEAHGEVRRSVSVTKRRSSRHEGTIRELQIGGPHAIRVGDVLSAFRGVLTGIPEYIGGANPLLTGEGDGTDQ